MTETATASSVAAVAGRLGVVDALVFRRISASTWAHLGGLGRGRGWAGVVDVDVAVDHLLANIPARVGGVHAFDHPQIERVLGPYYAFAGAFVRVSNDVVVVLGNPTRSLSAAASEPELRRLAEMVEGDLDDIAPSKRLGDELEILHALRELTTGTAPDLAGALKHVVEVAAAALSCELGLLRDGAGRSAGTSSWSGVDLGDPALGAVLDALEQRVAGGPVCVQDIDLDPVLDTIGRAQGVRSVLALAIPAPAGGLLVLAHTDAGPRGFTALCQNLATQIAEAASVVAHTAALREELRAVADEHARTARCDPLTGLGNRLAWDEALEQAQARVDAGDCITVVTLDIDGLKEVNDTFGHVAGDDLLRRCADVLREHGRKDDVAVRLGGDEFALLLPIGPGLAGPRTDSLRISLGGVTSARHTVVASLGTATATAGTSVADAVREADAAMYADKRARRGPAGRRPVQLTGSGRD